MNKSSKILIVIAIAVCAVAIFLGNKKDDAEKKATPEPVKQETKQEVYKYEEEPVSSPIETEGELSQEENFSKQDLDSSKKLAIDFVKAYHNFDASKPLQNIENSKNFMSKDLYESNIKNPSRGTLDAVKKKWVEVGVTDTANKATDRIVWNVVVQSENVDNDGKKNFGEDWYLVELKKEQGQYKVTDVVIDAIN